MKRVTRSEQNDKSNDYHTADWFTPVSNTDDKDDPSYKSLVCHIKASHRWIKRNGKFEGKYTKFMRKKGNIACKGASSSDIDSDSSADSDASLGSAPEALCGAHIDVYWDQGAIGWYTAKVVSAQTQADKSNASATSLLKIVYDDGEEDNSFSLREWLWSVSARSSDWLAEYKSDAHERKQATKVRKRKRRITVLHSDSEQEEDKEDQATEAGDEITREFDSSTDEDTSNEYVTESSGGVLSYDDALRFCDYEHDQRCDPLYTSVGGMAFHICNDRWRHAFHHVPNHDFARDILRACSGPLLPGLEERRKRCKLCASGTCRRHGKGSGVSGPSGSFPDCKENTRCAMCNRRRTCVHVQLGALSERWVPMGSCCLRKLDAMIVLYRALEGIKSLRDNTSIIESNAIGENCNDHRALMQKRVEAVREPVDAFNRAVNEFDNAMGMDMKYERFGSHGSDFYQSLSQ